MRIARQGRDLVGHLDVRGGPSPASRDLASSTRDCRELVDSLAVAIAIGIDPLSLSRVPQALPTLPAAPASTTPAPTPAAAPPSARESPPSREEPAAVRSADPVHLRAGFGPVVSFGAAPSTNLGIRAQIGARWRAVSLGIEGRAISLGIEGRADFPVSQAAVDGGRVSASLLVGSFVPCVHNGVILGCLLGTFGAMRASGESVTSPLHEDKFYAAAGGRVGVEIPIGSFLAIQLHGDIRAPLTQITLRLNDRDVWTTPVASDSLGASLAGTS